MSVYFKGEYLSCKEPYNRRPILSAVAPPNTMLGLKEPKAIAGMKISCKLLGYRAQRDDTMQRLR